ncbi:MAG: ABC transporter permease [Halanaerobiales bacterium]
MFLFRLALRNLTRHKRRTLITASIIAVAIFFYIFLDSLMLGMMEKSFENIINLESGHLQLADSRYWEKREDLPLKNLISPQEDVLTEIKQQKGFEGLTPLLRFGATLNTGRDELPVIGVGIDPETYSRVFTTNNYFTGGSMLRSGKYQAVVGNRLADLMEVEMGDYITLLVRSEEQTFNTIDAEISGLLHTPNPEVNENMVFVPLDIVQSVLDTGDRVTQLAVRMEDREQGITSATELKGQLEGDSNLNFYTWRDSAEFMIAMSQAQQIENRIILGIILLIAAVGIINTVILSALERMEEIGMMKAMGLQEREIVFTFALEATGIGIIGGCMGCLAAVAAVGLFHKYGIDFFALMSDEVMTFGVPILGRIYGVWNPQAFIFVFFFGVLVSLVVSIFPSLWAARKDPVKSIYHR